MVKNTTGGSKTKGQARKFATPKQSNILRVSLDECEVYAQVTKLLGNGMCHVLCIDGFTRLCHIRGKFRGRGKRDNLIGSGNWLLVGLREWEIGKDISSKLQNCDLLEVYNNFDKEKLKNTVRINWAPFIANDNALNNVDKGTGDELFEFTDEKVDEYRELIENQISNTKVSSIVEDDTEINVDDI